MKRRRTTRRVPRRGGQRGTIHFRYSVLLSRFSHLEEKALLVGERKLHSSKKTHNNQNECCPLWAAPHRLQYCLYSPVIVFENAQQKRLRATSPPSPGGQSLRRLRKRSAEPLHLRRAGGQPVRTLARARTSLLLLMLSISATALGLSSGLIFAGCLSPGPPSSSKFSRPSVELPIAGENGGERVV